MPEISVIVPTLNEAANLAPLAERIDAALAGRSYQLLIVDDNSQDGTPQVCERLAQRFPLCLIVRQDAAAGLSGAVLAGMAQATGEYLVVLDADLQHPPEKIPDLLALLESDRADFAIGSRYVPGGTMRRQWGFLRRLNSRFATLLARPFSGPVHDPMSGFFALRRSTYERAERLLPLGYKIALELMSKCRVQRVAEVPIEFGLRHQGQSKLTLAQQFRYLEHLSRLYDFSFPRLSPVVKFLIVLLVSWTAAWGACRALGGAGMTPVPAVVVAYVLAVLITAVFHARYVRTQREFLVRQAPWRDFALISLGEVLACALAARYIAHRVAGAWPMEIFLAAFSAATVVRYILRKELLQDLRGLRKSHRD